MTTTRAETIASGGTAAPTPSQREGAAAQGADRGPARTALRASDVLSIRDGRFWLEGSPFAEISFNKFDLFWHLYDELAAGRPLDDANPMLRAQERALRNLRDMGFRSVRFFALPWGPAGPASYADPAKRRNLWAALDRTVELSERYGIGLVWSLAAATFTDTRLTDQGWVHGEEQMRELIANRNSRGRQLLYRYIDDVVERYRGRKAVLMWEISNEVTLAADIGDQDRVFEGQRMPTLREVAVFFDDVARRIKAVDRLRLVTSGGSNMRESQWNLYTRRSWDLDTFEEQFRCFELLYARSAIDVIHIHSYMNNRAGFVIRAEGGGTTHLDHRGYMEMARRLRKPLIIGELGRIGAPRTDERVWQETPDYFTSMEDPAAVPWVRRSLDSVVEAGVQLTYWWAYQSDRPMDQTPGTRWFIERELTPELMRHFIEANRRLKSKLRAH
ncbi:MAG TPA: hypothetical protein VLH79_15515 [Chthonomonadales bacterium]|nr:hypothetical protein [Chthonomonadales bacterium]